MSHVKTSQLGGNCQRQRRKRVGCGVYMYMYHICLGNTRPRVCFPAVDTFFRSWPNRFLPFRSVHLAKATDPLIAAIDPRSKMNYYPQQKRCSGARTSGQGCCIPFDLGRSVVGVGRGEGLEGRHGGARALRVRVVDHDVSERLGRVQGLVPGKSTSSSLMLCLRWHRCFCCFLRSLC